MTWLRVLTGSTSAGLPPYRVSGDRLDALLTVPVAERVIFEKDFADSAATTCVSSVPSGLSD